MKHIINLQKDWKEIDVKLNDLLLDEENIRLDISNKTQDVVINDLFINEDAFQILESIYKNGLFPDEIPVAIEKNKKYIIIDGNRRTASLKAMLNPSIAPKLYRQKIEKMMTGYTPIDKIKIILAPSRNDVNKYLAAKHTKTTRRPWTALRRAYFYYAQKENGTSIEDLIKTYEINDIPKYIKMYEMHKIALSLDNISDAVRLSVSSKNFEISTLERLYNDKYVQEQLGISFNNTTGQVSVPDDSNFYLIYSKIITDIVNKTITSREKIKDESDRKIYIDGLLLGKKILSTSKIGADKFIPRKIKKNIRKNLIPEFINSTLNSPTIERVLEELKTVQYRKFPNLSGDALRSLLEAVLKKYFDRIGNPIPKKAKYTYLQDALTHSKNHFISIKNQEMKQIIERIESKKEFLEMINHNPSVFAVPDDVENMWDLMQELFIFVFQDAKKYKNKK